jgi:hypothetical protein
MMDKVHKSSDTDYTDRFFPPFHFALILMVAVVIELRTRHENLMYLR